MIIIIKYFSIGVLIYPDEILVVSVRQIESLSVGIVFQDLDQQLLSNEDIATVKFGTVIRGFEQLLSQPHGDERVEVQIALIQSFQLQTTIAITTGYYYRMHGTAPQLHVPFPGDRRMGRWCS